MARPAAAPTSSLITLSLTDFLTIVSAGGTAKASKIRQVKKRPSYQPAFDFYRDVREHIKDVHANGLPKKSLNNALVGLNKKKVGHYTAVVHGYSKWWGRKNLAYFQAQKAQFVQAGVAVNVRPELGLSINGTPHLIKLYFKGTPLTSAKAAIIAHLMEQSLRPVAPNNAVMAVLDVQHSKLVVNPASPSTLGASLVGELAYIAAIYPLV